MTETERRQVVEADDESLRRLIHDHLKVFAKFTSDNCAACEAMAPHFTQVMGASENASILFVRLNSDQNPVAKKMMQEQAAPFFVSYCQGRLLECAALTTTAEMAAQLTRLRNFMPVQ